MSNYKDISGQRFGRLTVAGKEPLTLVPTKWLCRCDCGNEIDARLSNLTSGSTKSCGCLRKELASARQRRHGMFGTKVYTSWSAMLYRCRNPKAKPYPLYGGRGISVCERWLDFKNFYVDMGPTHWDGAEIDRIDPNGNYEPSNCRWLSASLSQSNKTCSIQVLYEGKEWYLADLCRSLGLSRRHVNSRLALGWDLTKALLTPVASQTPAVFVVGGEVGTIKQICQKYSVDPNVVRSRLYRGQSIERAIGLTGAQV